MVTHDAPGSFCAYISGNENWILEAKSRPTKSPRFVQNNSCINIYYNYLTTLVLIRWIEPLSLRVKLLVVFKTRKLKLEKVVPRLTPNDLEVKKWRLRRCRSGNGLVLCG